MPPYTKATAMKYGWDMGYTLIFKEGFGYVYSSKFISSDEAERINGRLFRIESRRTSAQSYQNESGKTRNIWVKNCLSIGLSGGFIEPLESTGIALIITGLRKFSYYFPDKTFNPKLIEKYNHYMTEFYESTRDFLVMHYCTTEREDTEYWKNARYGSHIPDSLKDDLALYKENRISFNNQTKTG